MTMQTGRAYVDYALQRRALLASLARGLATTDDVCDANPYLLRAAKFHGVPTDTPCPVCRRGTLTQVHWVFGDQIAGASGSARVPAELERMEQRFGEFDVYQVEVCRSCRWNHLLASFVLGRAGAQMPRRPRRAAR